MTVASAAHIQVGTSEKRKANRLRLPLVAGFRESRMSKVPVDVFDLSTDGFRVETFMGVHENATVWLTLPGLEPQEAKVVWMRKDFVGCKFVRPLHPAVFQMIASRA